MSPLRLLLPGLLLCAALARGAAPLVRLEASTEWAENISRSAAASDWHDAMRQEIRVNGGWLRQWTDGFVTTVIAQAGGEHVPRFSRNDAYHGGFALQARQKFGWGAYAPMLEFETGLSHRTARIDGGDGWTTSAAAHFGRRLTSAWRMGATGDWEEHSARSPIWDTRHHRLFGTITWDITPWLQLSHANGRLWGTFTANASGPVWGRAMAGALGPEASAYYRTVPRGITEAFGPGWVTYRVAGRVSFWWLELSPALGRDTSLPLRYESRFSVNLVGIKYRQDLWSLQWLHRF